MKQEKKERSRKDIGRRIGRTVTVVFLILALLPIAAGVWVRKTFTMQFPEALLLNAEHRRSPSFYWYSFTDRTSRAGERQALPEGMYAQKPHLLVNGSDIPVDLKNAFLAIEDKRFYQHKGVDWYRTVAAGLNCMLGFSSQFGGSTVTQQLVKNVTGNNEVTPRRKLQEILYALDLERRLDKSQILEWYLNVIHFSDRCEGVAEAAEHYFSKRVDELTLAQCASLAAIANSPAYYHPVRHPENNLRRRNLILSEMRRQGMIGEEDYLAACDEALCVALSAAQSEDGINSWYIDMVLEDVIRDLMLEYRISRAEASRWINYGGLSIDVAMDPEIQSTVEDYYRKLSGLPISQSGASAQSALILIHPETGDILGVAGGVGEKKGNLLQNLATQTLRPPGSCLKPISVYAPALENGLIHWGSVYDDVPVRISEDGKSLWPRNANGVYRGLTTVSYAVAHSTNTVAVRVLEELGLERSFSTVREKFHLPLIADSRGNDRDYAALALGQLNLGVTLRDMTAAYTPFADGGLYHAWRSYFRVLDAEGNLLLSKPDRTERVLSPGNAAIMTKLLEGCVKEGTASSITLRGLVECAGKTGTTANEGDRWFIGYTPELLCGVWCGYEYPEPLKGRTLCTGIWNDVMTSLTQKRGGKEQFPIPDDVIRLSFCQDSGERMSNACLLDPRGSREAVGWFLRSNLPLSSCHRHVLCPYDGQNGGVAHEGTPEENRIFVGLLQLDHTRPPGVRVTDAEYAYFGDPLTMLPNPDAEKAYFAHLEGDLFGASRTALPYNRSAPIQIEEEDGEEKQNGQSHPSPE
ncbi:MAG: transglycosylase domain-containing protein [Clostridia bacterium]|nr:transglycosylase domain-containing protein [Clostridia bacterium]